VEPVGPANKSWKVKIVKWRKKAGGGKQPYQGYFFPGNPEKYEGNVDKIIFRSGIELRLFKYLDEQPGILAWSSEELTIPYRSPIDGRIHRYFPDVKFKARRKNGSEQTYLVEVKPSYQCVRPTPPKKPNKRSQARYLRESTTYGINLAKWKAAETLCERKGWTFMKWTEKQLVF
jgi:hypothetical protein